jgi:nucleoside-diphosphate-sugar epimerase
VAILVAGASGFLGRRLVERLSVGGYEVLAFARRQVPDEFRTLPGVRWLTRDIARDGVDLAELPQHIDTVLHLAGATLGAGKDESMFLSANEQTTVRLCQALADRTEHFIFASSQVVYGNPCHLAVSEDFPLRPDSSAYACSKLNSENWLRWFHKRYGGQYLSLRLCGFIEGGGIVDYLIDRGLSGEIIELFANGTVRRDYLHVEKAIDVMVSALNYKGSRDFLPVNIGSGQAISAQELATLVCSELQSPSLIHLLDSPSPQGDFVFNIDLASRLFDFRPGSLAEAVRSYTRLRKDKLRRG